MTRRVAGFAWCRELLVGRDATSRHRLPSRIAEAAGSRALPEGSAHKLQATTSSCSDANPFLDLTRRTNQSHSLAASAPASVIASRENPPPQNRSGYY